MRPSTVAKRPWSAMSRNRKPKAENKSILALHEFFKRIVDASGDNAHVTLHKIMKRLSSSNRVRQPVKVSKIVECVENTGKVALVVAKVLDDERLLTLPRLNIVALKWSKSVQKKIEAAGGSISTLDCFVKVSGNIDNIVLVSGYINARKASKYFGPAPGERGSSTYPRCGIKGKNAEKRIRMKKPIDFSKVAAK